MLNDEVPSSSFGDTWMSRNEIFSLPPAATTEGSRRREVLKRHWRQATKCFSSADPMPWFDEILSRHCAAERAYHTVVHVEEMLGYLELLDRRKIDDSDYAVLVLSIFFHDAVYDVRSSTNEKDSAKLFQEFCKEMGESDDPNLESRVVSYILATQHHKACVDDTSLGLLLDFDMAVLGKEPHAYQQYARLIRKEYEFVDPPLYCEKRAEILQTFLQQPLIFCSEMMGNALEERARKNLQQETDMLRKGIIPGESS